ncbi:MAG: hypothetical protein R2857_11195 [Vampirovibrionales bacterium]
MVQASLDVVRDGFSHIKDLPDVITPVSRNTPNPKRHLKNTCQ